MDIPTINHEEPILDTYKYCHFFRKLNGNWVHVDTEKGDVRFGCNLLSFETILYQDDSMICSVGHIGDAKFIVIYCSDAMRIIPQTCLPAIALEGF